MQLHELTYINHHSPLQLVTYRHSLEPFSISLCRLTPKIFLFLLFFCHHQKSRDARTAAARLMLLIKSNQSPKNLVDGAQAYCVADAYTFCCASSSSSSPLKKGHTTNRSHTTLDRPLLAAVQKTVSMAYAVLLMQMFFFVILFLLRRLNSRRKDTPLSEVT